MGELILVTGGTRSGKSEFAEKIIGDNNNVVYVATSISFDEEMKRRIQIHKDRRNKKWTTLESYKDFDKILIPLLENKKFIMLDCITIMITNIIFNENKFDWDKITKNEIKKIEENILLEINNLLKVVKIFRGKTILVTNEIGMGIVPENSLSRFFRDIAGIVNQKIAEESDRVYFVVSGIPMKIKG